MKSKKFLPLLVAVVLAFTASSASAAAGDTATGSGSTQPGEAFSFSAAGTSVPFPGSASGEMSYTGPVPQLGGVFFSGTATVDCLVVDGNRATLRGTITASPTHTEFIGGRLRFFVEDNGVPGVGQDRFVGGPFDTQDFGCGIAPGPAGSGSPLTAGEIVVGAGDCKEKKDPSKNKCKDKDKA